jgi:hypothetical protein
MCRVKRLGLYQNKGSHKVEPSTSLILVKPTAEEGIAECKVRIWIFLNWVSQEKKKKVIRKARRLGGENGQFRHNKASNA